MKRQNTAFVTGVAGFCSRHLVAHLLDEGYNLTGLDRESLPNSAFQVYGGDVLDTAQLAGILGQVQPDVVFHLAALTNPRLDYQTLHRVNALGTLSLLDAVRQTCPHAVVLTTGSSAVYGRVSASGLPIAEDQPFHPTNPYAVSKVAQEMVAYQQFAQHSLRVICTRAFNITGPGENANFATSAFARQIAEIEAGLREPVIETGNLDAVRDFSDVRDVVRAYRLLGERGEPGEVYNVCSGQGTAIRRILDILLELAKTPDISIQLDPDRLQPADVPIQVGDSTRLRALTGWKPAIPLRQTLQDVLDFWRQRIAGGV